MYKNDVLCACISVDAIDTTCIIIMMVEINFQRSSQALTPGSVGRGRMGHIPEGSGAQERVHLGILRRDNIAGRSR